MVLGISNRTSSNKGEGRKNDVTGLFNLYTLTRQGESNLAYRDYDFNKTKTEHQISAYLEDRIFKKFTNHQVLNVDVGIRFDDQLGSMSLQPRVNSSYTFNKTFRIRAGGGIASKAPSLNQLYTGERYFDKLVGGGIYAYPGIYQKAWIQTIITPGDNLNLKPSKSYRTEVGLDIKLPLASLNFTGYYNKLFNGFSNQQIPVYKIIPKAEIIVNGTEIPTYQITGTEKFYYMSTGLTNNSSSEDKGIEATINFKKIKSLNLDVSMNASYTYTKDFSDVTEYYVSSSLTSPERYGVYDRGKNFMDNLTTSFNFNYHIPAVGLLVSLRSEHVLLRNTKTPSANLLRGYLDTELVYHQIPVEDRNSIQKYGHLIRVASETQSELKNMLHNFHLRVSKDFSNGFSVSFYSSNFLNLKPFYYDLNGNKTLYNIASLSFGASLNYEF